MELYEIVKFTRKPIKGEEYFEPEVITATMDKKLAEQMLEIYKQNSEMNESYQIRTLRELEEKELHSLSEEYKYCLWCDSYDKCVKTALERPNEMIRCIRYGTLKKYAKFS